MLLVACGDTQTANTPTPVPTSTTAPSNTSTPEPVPTDTASAITQPPADMSNVNAMHVILRSEEVDIRFGTQADASTVTLGPTDGGIPDYPPYEGKNSLNIKMPLMTPIIAPIDMEFIGFKNRSATFHQDTSDSPRMEPFDDLELCFESVSADWPGMIMCVYHLHTSPLLRSHLANDDCGIQEKWTGTGAEKGRIYYLENSSDLDSLSAASCDPMLGTILKRGDLLGYSGQVGNNPHSGFRFKVKSDKTNPLTNKGDPYLHWVQPTAFFYWQCFDSDTTFQPGILAYPFDCKLLTNTPVPIPTNTPVPIPTNTPVPRGFTYSLEKIPGSPNHSHASGVATWWGYNQSKIVRYGDTVFTYVIQNDKDLGTESLMSLYKKVGEGPWEQGASMPCSVPGNILIDSKGGLHTLVFDPGDILANDSLGSLEYYYFSQAGNGDIDNFTHETVIPWTEGNETVNIRIGASIGLDDTIALAFGLGTTEQFYYKKKSATEWYHFIAGENLGHNFYYPYPLVTDDGYAILAIQDDYVEIDGQAHNPYHIAAYFQGDENGWSHEYLLDNTQSSQALTLGITSAEQEWQTVDISDLYMDSNGGIHVVLQDRVAEKWLHYRKAYADSDWTITTIDTGSWKGINWMRLIEIEGNLYYFMNSWNQVRLMNSNTKKMVKLDLESLAGKRQVEGMYPYIASPKTGTSAASEFVDILLLNGDAGAYPNGPNYYLKIAKDYFLQELPPTPTPTQVPTTATPAPTPTATPAPTPTATPAPTPTATLVPAAVFKPSLEKSYEVSVEDAVVYGTGGTLDGGEVELLLDLAIPDTGTDGPRPLLVHIHGGSFQTGNRASQFNVAKRGWVAASIDYRLAGDEPLPGPRVKPFFDAVGGKSSSARNRSVVASVEDTLVALDYLLSRADELNIDTDRIVLKGESAGAFIALNVAYCADKFEISGPTIAAVIDFAGGISEIFCGGGTAIDPGEAAVFIAHGTADATVSFTDRALSIVDGATAAGITYEFHPLEGEGHEWLLGMLGQTTADGRKIDDLMYEFLNRVLYDR